MVVLHQRIPRAQASQVAATWASALGEKPVVPCYKVIEEIVDEPRVLIAIEELQEDMRTDRRLFWVKEEKASEKE